MSEYGNINPGALFGSRRTPLGRDGRPLAGSRGREQKRTYFEGDKERTRIHRVVDPPISRTIGNMIDRPRRYYPPSKKLVKATERPLEIETPPQSVDTRAKSYATRNFGHDRLMFTSRNAETGRRSGFWDRQQRERLASIRAEYHQIGE